MDSLAFFLSVTTSIEQVRRRALQEVADKLVGNVVVSQLWRPVFAHRTYGGRYLVFSFENRLVLRISTGHHEEQTNYE